MKRLNFPNGITFVLFCKKLNDHIGIGEILYSVYSPDKIIDQFMTSSMLVFHFSWVLASYSVLVNLNEMFPSLMECTYTYSFYISGDHRNATCKSLPIYFSRLSLYFVLSWYKCITDKNDKKLYWLFILC